MTTGVGVGASIAAVGLGGWTDLRCAESAATWFAPNNEGFHQTIRNAAASPMMIALSKNPTITRVFINSIPRTSAPQSPARSDT
jgi:hypothetical protein